MALNDLLSHNSEHKWFTLDQLIESVIADVVSADANFQLTQAQAWRDFGKSLNEFSQIPIVDQIDFSVGFGRLENLGIQELSVELPLEMYHPGFFRKAWWGFLAVFGRKITNTNERFKLAKAGNKGVVELNIKVKRDQHGHWKVEPTGL